MRREDADAEGLHGEGGDRGVSMRAPGPAPGSPGGHQAAAVTGGRCRLIFSEEHTPSHPYLIAPKKARFLCLAAFLLPPAAAGEYHGCSVEDAGRKIVSI